MTRFTSLRFGALAVLLAATSVSLAGQAPPASANQAAKTPWGDPNLQGIWRGYTGIPFERPARFKGRELLTDEEVAAKRKAMEATNEKTRKGENYEFFFRAQANLNEIFHYDEVLAPISRRTAQIVDPPDGRLPMLTPQAVKLWEEREAKSHGRGEADHWTDRGLSERCINTFPMGRVAYWGLGDPAAPRPVRGIGSVQDASIGLEGGGITSRDDTDGAEGANDRPTVQILQSPGFVSLVYIQPNGLNGETLRVVPVDKRPPFGSNVRQFVGSARGHWEGDTLVIETTNFNDPEPNFATYGIRRYPGTAKMLKITERIRRIDADHIENRWTVEDPETYVRPYTALSEFEREDKFIWTPGLCHENNKDTAAQMAAARSDEANAQDVVAEYVEVRQQRLEEVKAAVAEAQKSR